MDTTKSTEERSSSSELVTKFLSAEDLKRESTRPTFNVLRQPTKPTPDKPGRLTNQLKYIRFTILNSLFRHKDAGPFKEPVNPIKSAIPDYYDFIKYPMDLGTIRERLKNKFYWSGQECLRDFEYMFTNCYFYNHAESVVVKYGRALEVVFLDKLQDLPEIEEEIQELAAKKSTSREVNLANGPLTLDGKRRVSKPPKRWYINDNRTVRRPSSSPKQIESDSTTSDSVSDDDDSPISDASRFRQKQMCLLQTQLETITKQMDLLRQQEEEEKKVKTEKKYRKRKSTSNKSMHPKYKQKKTEKVSLPNSVNKGPVKRFNTGKEISSSSYDSRPYTDEDLCELEKTLELVQEQGSDISDVLILFQKNENGTEPSASNGSGELDLTGIQPRQFWKIKRLLESKLVKKTLFRRSPSPTAANMDVDAHMEENSPEGIAVVSPSAMLPAANPGISVKNACTSDEMVKSPTPSPHVSPVKEIAAGVSVESDLDFDEDDDDALLYEY